MTATGQTARVVDDGTLLGALDESARNELFTRGVRRRYPAGSTLFAEGDRSDRCFLLEHGNVKIVQVTADGREVLLGVRGAGELIGEWSVIDDEPRSASAVALEPVDAVQLDAGQFLGFLEGSPKAAMWLVRSVLSRIRDSDRKRAEFSAADAGGRLARRLAELADEHGEAVDAGVQISLPLSQEELAGWTGASREAVAKALAQFRSRGWLSTERRRITVHDLEALRRRGAGPS
ncbi:MAG: family transcriptional regulator, cyclic receptor protein [Frankiales bacterium]|nr:family transcriptional regulator, cyclic receptor protein [Frankiales bacterium]